MKPHEPCDSLGDCFHSRGGRIGGRNQPREAKVRGGRNQPREAKVRGGRNQPREAKVRSGRIGVRNQPREAKVRGARKLNETWGKTPEARGARARAGRKSIEKLRTKPNNKEATVAALFMTFAPDVWADTIWQRGWASGRLHGVPDIRHPTKVVGEYDGGAHHLHRDRSANDEAKDAERRAAGYVVVRETDPFVLTQKFAYSVRRRK